jgi:S1-C subfamily serine protease/dienelactone hydrolase
MARRYWIGLLAVGTVALVPLAMRLTARAAEDDDLDELRQEAIKAAVKHVAPHVVQIETSGGADVIRTAPGPQGRLLRTAFGPTTGVIVSSDGYIITSAFNFISKPSAIRVLVPGQKERLVATVVATDQTRMLTLLKVEATGLPVPMAIPKDEIKVGQTSLAVGRTLNASIDEPPSMSEGIISAKDRIWGRALQTDAKVSPINYGGPLIDLTGRVQGILVPASPRAEGETSGLEWYDSGIGFAIPLEDINKTLPRLKTGKDLKPGIIGINTQTQDMFSSAPKVTAIQPGSAADREGIHVGDELLEIDGKPVTNSARMRQILGAKYEGDVITVKVKRGAETKTFAKLTLGSAVAAFGQAFLGILPMRDDPQAGVEIRYVFPKSPAETAGLKEGDRILKASGRAPTLAPIKDRNALTALLDTMAPALEMKLEVKRKDGGKTETITVKLGEMPESVPDKLPAISSKREKDAEKKDEKKDEEKKDDAKKDDKKDEAKKDDAKKDEAKKDDAKKDEAKKDDAKKDDAKKDDKKDDKEDEVETGLFKKTTAAADHSYYVFVPENYKPKVSHALVIWLHPLGKGSEREIKNFKSDWEDFCEDQHMIVLAPLAGDAAAGWTPAESDFIIEAAKYVTDTYNIDRKRIVVHGMGLGGQMAFYMGFHNRTLVRGVATTGAAMTSNPKERIANQPLAFFLSVGDKDPLKDSVKETHKKLVEYKFSAIYNEIKDLGHEYLDLDALKMLVRWIDSMDRI